jgi:hypothetical protein
MIDSRHTNDKKDSFGESQDKMKRPLAKECGKVDSMAPHVGGSQK